MNAIEKKLRAKIGESWKGATPGFVIQVHENGRKRAELAFGKTYPYYDLASLTKIVFSATALMNLVDQKLIDLNRPVREELDWFQSPAPKNRQRVRDLLTHSAGLTWWKPFYKTIDRKKPRAQRWQQLEGLVAKEMRAHAKRAKFDGKAIYSDLDLFSLGAIMVDKTGMSFDEIWEPLRERLNLRETRFHPGNRPPHARSCYAPTEKCSWRGKVMRGEVHDENTWALGGVAPHAGLFGPIDELSEWGLALRRGMLGASSRKSLARPETVQLFTKRSLPRKQGDWGLGFMMPSRGTASCGRYFSSQSVGHLGFTGTSLWFDPKRDLLVTILSNRVYPTRDNKLFPSLRPSLHNLVVESL